MKKHKPIQDSLKKSLMILYLEKHVENIGDYKILIYLFKC